MTFDLVTELKNLLKLYKAFVDEVGSKSEETEERVISMIEDKNKDGVVKREDVIFVEKNGYDSNLINADIVKVVSRIQIVHLIILTEGIELKLTERDENILRSISNGKDMNLLFMEKDGRVSYVDEEVKAYFHNAVEEKVTDEVAQNLFEEYKDRYEEFKKFKEAVKGGKEGVGK